MKNILDIIKLVLVLALVGYFADSGLTIYKTNIRNTAIDGCANSSKYQASYKENNRDIVISQTQTLLYESCLKDKGISTNPNR